ncbi:MAG: tetratricopeptide repeat protein [Candidatus Dormibacteraeota bacterium]|nr:tetratricopeptide repeat protein [Candidatus Dormibacteraeota bacterium]
MMKPPERVEIPEAEDLRRERFARILAVLIVIATLGVASVEYLHSVAEKNADAAGVEAQTQSIQRQGDLVRAQDAAHAQIDIYAHQQQQRAAQGNAFQEYLAPSVAQGSTQAQVLQDEENRWSTLASLTGDLTSIKPNTATSPQNDTAFPNVLFSQSERDADRLFALLDAQNQLRSDWLGRAGLLSVILTLLAVAIYLFGLSLTLQAAVRRWLVGLGVVLVVVGGLATIVLQFGNPGAPPDAAADAYSEGVYALNTFYTKPGDAGLRDAYTAFTKAIQLRPRFAQAYLQRSQVQFLLGSPQRQAEFADITTASALQAQGSDLQQAYDLGLRDKLLLNNLAANQLLLGITQSQSGRYGDAVTNLDAALALDSNDPLLYYNKGLALLAQGKSSQAQQAYHDAVAHTVYIDVAHRVARGDPATEENYVGGALSSLDLLAAHHSGLAAQVKAAKEMIVAGVTSPNATPGAAPTFKMSAIDVFPAELQWSAQIDGVDLSAKTTTVSTQWYYQDPHKLGWSVIPALSGPSAAATSGVTVDNAVYQDTCSTCAADEYFLINSSLKASGQCLQPGQYRAEVYINGHLAGTGTSDGSSQTLQSQVFSDLGMDFCHPVGWTEDTTNTTTGFSGGFTTKDGSSGAYFVRFQNPEVSPGTSAATEAQSFRDEMLSVFASVLPSDAGTPAVDCGTNSNGTNTLPWGPTLDSSCNRTDAFFLGLTGATETWYTYNGGELHIGTGVTGDGAVLGAFTFGPSSQWQASGEPLPDVVFDSIVFTG